MATGVPYLGSKISLISKSEIRYEGILYTIDTQESTVALAKVRSFGTEDRPTDRPVAPRDDIYEYIIFRGSDIKDIRVCEQPKPRPVLQGGLPNDPAILQHSSAPAPTASSPPAPSGGSLFGSGGGASAAPAPPQTGGDSFGKPLSFGPIGSGAGNAAVAVSREARASESGSPAVGDPGGARKSGASSPTENHRDQQNAQRQQGGRGGRGGMNAQFGFQRGGGQGHVQGPRGGRGGFHQQSRGEGQGNFRGGRGRGGFVPGRPSAKGKDTLKFETEYDFEEANTQFESVLKKLQKTTLEDGANPEEAKEELENGGEHAAAAPEEVEEGEIKGDADEEEEVYYDKKKSFFDSISCEALERSKGRNTRPDWRAEKKLNKETFGVATHSGSGYHRGGYRYNHRGGRGYNRGGGYGRGGYGGGFHRGGGGGYNNYGRFSREQRAGGDGNNQGRGGGAGNGRFY